MIPLFSRFFDPAEPPDWPTDAVGRMLRDANRSWYPPDWSQEDAERYLRWLHARRLARRMPQLARSIRPRRSVRLRLCLWRLRALLSHAAALHK